MSMKSKLGNAAANTAVTHDPRWARIIARDRTVDGQFWYSVSTTGIYCRPSCASKLANPKNVRLHETLEQARETGFRPCKRCHPEGLSPEAQSATVIAQACRLIEQSAITPSLNQLANAADLSPSHFHRLFKSITGLTPHAYAAARRTARVRKQLSTGQTVTEAIYDAGFNSNGRFYENSHAMLGMTPTQFRAGGFNEEIRFAIGQCSLGAILVASSLRGVASILIGDDPEALARDLQDRFPKAKLIGGDADYESRVARVVGFVEAPRLGLDLPLDVRGTAFQQRVWQALREIPSGKTATYSDIARKIGAPKSTRAVAGACAANAIALAIPCHRVTRNDGALSGYRWGVERKRVLLEREGSQA